MITLDLHKKLSAPKGEMELSIQTQINPGEIIALYGESGAGKTSVLRMIAGLMTPDWGKITVKDKSWLDSSDKINLPPHQRKIGLVFQDYALFPNMTVRENLIFALEKNQDKTIVDELITITELGLLQHKKPESLSGGQKQRAALARALVRTPDILMLDEPLSAIDYSMRQKLQDFLLTIHQKYNPTILLVTHSISEIFRLANRVMVIHQGQIIKDGSPVEVFSKNNNHSDLMLRGEVINIEKVKDAIRLTILIGEDIIKYVLQEQPASTFKIGDKIVLKGSSTQLDLSR